MSLVLYHCWDGDTYCSEEASHMLVVAHNPRQACRLWRDALGLTLDEADECVERATWEWVTVPEPALPDAAGVYWPRQRLEFGPAYLGYGFWEDSDPVCDDCGDHVHEDDLLDISTEGEEYQACRWCVAEGQTTQPGDATRQAYGTALYDLSERAHEQEMDIFHDATESDDPGQVEMMRARLRAAFETADKAAAEYRRVLLAAQPQET